MSTPTGIEIIDCDQCGHRHPVTREHCPTCVLRTLRSMPWWIRSTPSMATRLISSGLLTCLLCMRR